MIAAVIDAATTLWASNHRGIPPITQVVKKTGTSLLEYWAIGPRGAAVTDPVWLVYKFTYDTDMDFVNARCSKTDVAQSDYATLTYS